MENNKGKNLSDKEYKKNAEQKEEQVSNNTNNLNQSNKTRISFNLVSIICFIAIIFSLYKIICWFFENQNNTKILSNIQSQTQVTQEQISVDGEIVNKFNYDFTNLLATNKNTVGWIYVPNTNIDYPVVQHTDNDYYLTHSFDNTQNSAGWIFADYRNNCDNLDYNTVIYGHNRKDKSMFGSLKNVLNSDWYSNEENLYINFSTLTENHVYKVFSTFVCNDADVPSYINTSFSSPDEFNSYLQKLKNASSYNFNTDLENTEHIITLYTCYGLNDQRLLVCAKLID